MSTEMEPKSAKDFFCEKCDFKCCKLSGWNRHISTAKHLFQQKINGPAPEKDSHICECGKQYSDRSGLWRHSKKCVIKNGDDTQSVKPIDDNLLTKNNIINEYTPDKSETVDEISKNDDLIQILINEYRDLKNLILEFIKNDKTNVNTIVNANTNINTNVNTFNKTFNLQFFLNEQCKDALNIGEFVDSIKIQLTDLEATGRQGYVEGITCIINKNLDKLDKFKRPIHCSDLKREVLYIKDNNEWIKEESNTPVLKKAIKQIANKNVLQINEWKKLHPGCTQSDSRKNDLYLNIVSNAMSGSTKEEQMKNYDKIVSNIIKGVVIEK